MLLGALPGSFVGRGMGEQGGLNEALGLAVGTGPVTVTRWRYAGA